MTDTPKRIERAIDAERRMDDIVGDRMNRIMRAGALEFTGRVIKRTPVDTGRLRANWNVSLNAPDLSTDEAGEDRQANRAIETQKRSENQTEIEKADPFGGDDIFVANGLPYARPIEEGHGVNNKPGGMVEVTVNELKPFFAKLAASVRVGG